MRALHLALCLALCLALHPASAMAQQIVIVVPRDAQVVVPPRGAAPPARTPAPALVAAPARSLPIAPAGAPVVLEPGAVGLAPVAGFALPLIATAILAGSLGSPSRTR